MVTMSSNASVNVAKTPLSPDVSTTTSQKKTSENRRTNKPIMEKRRRARINNSLNELKTLILDAMKKDPARHSKLEKADVLEMAVKHLESLHKHRAAMSTMTDKYRAGFSECANEVNRYPGLEPMVRRKLMQHLTSCLNLSCNGSQQSLQVHILPADKATAINKHDPHGAVLLNATTNDGVQMVPTRLPNGDIALILPSSSAAQIQHRLPVSPTPSYSISSPPPLRARIHHSRSTFTDCQSHIAFDRLSVNIPTSILSVDEMCLSPSTSVHSNYSSPQSPNSNTIICNYDNYSLYSPPLQKPLSLVMREEYADLNDDKPWRPW